MRLSHLFVIVALVGLFVAGSAQAAPLLAVDFNGGGNVTETGFSGMLETGPQPYTATFSTAAGNITVSVNSDHFFDRGSPTDSGAFTYGELYRDFAYNNATGSAINFVLSGPGIVANKEYAITWYAYDSNTATDNTVTFAATPLSNTSGSIGSVTYNGATPLVANDQFSFTGLWSATDNSLEIDATASVGSFIRVNGFQVYAPEPSSLALFAGAALVGFARRRRAVSR
jgi:hypothetical protein